MRSAQRHDEILRRLRSGEPTTVGQLADQLQVSQRTVFRDLEALRSRGIPLHASVGRGGGVRLGDDARWVPVQFRVDEIVALTLSVAMLRSAPWIPFAAGAESALRRARAGLPPDRARALRRLMRRIYVGGPATERVHSGMGTTDSRLLTTFERAFSDGLGLGFTYTDAKGRTDCRRIEPHGLLVRAPLWYILAWDVHRDAARTFRMDRIQRPAVQTRMRFAPRPVSLIRDALCPHAKPLRLRKSADVAKP